MFFVFFSVYFPWLLYLLATHKAYFIFRNGSDFKIVHAATLERSCRSNLLFQPITVYWHQANQSLHQLYAARCLAGQSLVYTFSRCWDDSTSGGEGGGWGARGEGGVGGGGGEGGEADLPTPVYLCQYWIFFFFFFFFFADPPPINQNKKESKDISIIHLVKTEQEFTFSIIQTHCTTSTLWHSDILFCLHLPQSFWIKDCILRNKW